jgi:hypothetical protein
MSEVPQLPWARVIFLALVLLACSIAGLDLFLRSEGFFPSVPDTVDLWRFWRQCIRKHSHRSIVFLGTSRIRSDIAMDVVARGLPAFRPVQLGVVGNKSPIGTLECIAKDDSFCGVIICELAAPFVNRWRWAEQRDYYETPSGSDFNRVVHAVLCDNMVVLYPRFSIAPLIKAVLTRRWPRHRTYRVRFDRSLSFYTIEPPPHSLDDMQFLPNDQVHVNEVESTENEGRRDEMSLAYRLGEVREMVQRIQARGGNVVFVGLPASSARSGVALRSFPRNLPWSQVAALTGAICVPLDDCKLAGPRPCADGVHLDRAGAEMLTKALLSDLRRQHVVP